MIAGSLMNSVISRRERTFYALPTITSERQVLSAVAQHIATRKDFENVDFVLLCLSGPKYSRMVVKPSRMTRMIGDRELTSHQTSFILEDRRIVQDI